MLYLSFYLGTCSLVLYCSSGVLQAKRGGTVMNWSPKAGIPDTRIPDSLSEQSQ